MAAIEPLRRYIILVNKLSSFRYPSLKDLLDYLEQHDIVVSERTLQRDIQNLRYSFNIDVKYDTFNKGYYIDDQDDFNLNNFMQLAQAKLRSDLFTSAVNQPDSLDEFVSFDNRDTVKGLVHLEPLFSAIQNYYVIKIVYQSYFREKETRFTLQPYHLREFDRRWYLVALAGKKELVFGLDRFVSVEVTARKFKRNPKIDPKERFDHIIGISWGEGKIEIIKLCFTVQQTNYIKSLPLHSSQVIESEDETGSDVTLTLEPNFEFLQRLMALGSSVKVVGPAWLAKEVANLHKQAFTQY